MVTTIHCHIYDSIVEINLSFPQRSWHYSSALDASVAWNVFSAKHLLLQNSAQVSCSLFILSSHIPLFFWTSALLMHAVMRIPITFHYAYYPWIFPYCQFFRAGDHVLPLFCPQLCHLSFDPH